MVAIALALSLSLAACGSSSKSGSSGDTGSGSGSVTLRLGYFANVTHAPAIMGVQSGAFAAKLGPNVKLELSTFNSGTEATTALLAGAIDASFVGPNPASTRTRRRTAASGSSPVPRRAERSS